MNIKFIKLHNANDNSVILVPADIIIYIKYLDGKSSIAIDSLIKPFIVNESPEKILGYLNTTNFIKLHEYDTNNIIILNTEYIVIYDSEEHDNKYYGNIYYTDMHNNNNKMATISVNEVPEKIFTLLNKNTK